MGRRFRGGLGWALLAAGALTFGAGCAMDEPYTEDELLPEDGELIEEQEDALEPGVGGAGGEGVDDGIIAPSEGVDDGLFEEGENDQDGAFEPGLEEPGLEEPGLEEPGIGGAGDEGLLDDEEGVLEPEEEVLGE